MFGIVAIIALIGVAILINALIGNLGQGIVKLFQKIGLGKGASYVFGVCIFLVILAILRYFIETSGLLAYFV